MLSVILFTCSLLLLFFVDFSLLLHLLFVGTFLLSFFFGNNLNLFYFFSMGKIFFDGMSLNLVMLSFWCGILMLLSSFLIFKKNFSSSLFCFSVIMLILTLMLSFFSKSLLLFYIWFEFSLIPTFFLIMKWGYRPERLQASMYMMLYTICASLPLLLSMVYFFSKDVSLNMSVMSYINISYLWVWGGFLVLAFFVKMPLYFFHLWLPKAHVEAPVAGSMILAGVLLKLGSYGLVRVTKMWYMLLYNFSELFMTVSLLGGVLTGMICVCQSDLKSLIAYSSIGHMGVVTAGVLSFSYVGVIGAIIMMIAHGICSSGMFFISSIYYQNSKSRSVLMNKGVMFSFPLLVMFSFLIFSCNMSAPPSINLGGELLLSMSVMSFSLYAGVPIGLMVFLAGVYSMYLYVLSSHGSMTKNFNTWLELKGYDIFCLCLHFFPIWILILNLKIFI
uniref:NADH-ubiquinone oxidoreductase chain 4 n=1 Tax=Loxocorone allax TaxID=393181 RepID=B1B1W3_LOXAA|nr:NADH dehydrogenase subunit 4 [Loxocorone allax]BAG12578.1 NADH dehydrogenase subunit 4 [Loxocorone allax]